MEIIGSNTKMKNRLIICAAIMLLATGLGIGLLAGGGTGPGTRTPANILDENAMPHVQNAVAEAAKSGIEIPGYATVRLPAGQTEVEFPFTNPAGNPCWLQYEVLLEDGESLYASGLVEPGSMVSNVTLARGLEAGEYRASIKVRTFAFDGVTELNGASLVTTLLVE